MEQHLHFVIEQNFPAVTLSHKQVEIVLRDCSVRKLNKGEYLFFKGDATVALFAVLSGEFEAAFTAAEGATSVIELIPKGRLFGLASFASGRPSTYDVSSKRSSSVFLIGPKAYFYLMDEVPGFARALLREFACRYDGALRLLEGARHRPAREQLINALLQMVRDERVAYRENGRCFIKATQDELAALANLSRQTVNELLAELQKLGKIERVYGGLWINDELIAQSN